MVENVPMNSELERSIGRRCHARLKEKTSDLKNIFVGGGFGDQKTWASFVRENKRLAEL